MFVRILFYGLVVYAVTVMLVYFMQRHMQYTPNKDYPGTPAQNNVPEMQEVRVKTDDGHDNIGWFAPPREKSGRTVILYHGNAGHIGHRAHKARIFLDRGFGVFLCEYRGFGGNKGYPSEEGLYKDGRACLKWLEDKGYLTSQFIIYGESIGSGVATQIASEIQPRMLILEAPFTSAADVARIRYFFLPVDQLLKDRYDNAVKIVNVKSHLLIVHGDADGLIPIAQSNRLFEIANDPKEFISIKGGGHSNLYDYRLGDLIADWMEKTIAERK